MFSLLFFQQFLSPPFIPHYKSILNGLTAAQTRLYSYYFFFYFCFASSIYLLMPINLISLLSSSETRRTRGTKTEREKKKSNLCFGLCWTFVRTFISSAIAVVVDVFCLLSSVRIYNLRCCKSERKTHNFYSKITGTCRMNPIQWWQEWRRSNLIVNRWSFRKLETNSQTTSTTTTHLSKSQSELEKLEHLENDIWI